MTKSLGIVDVNVQLGPVAGGARGAPMDAVLAERDRHGIRVSLVRHRTALLGEAGARQRDTPRRDRRRSRSRARRRRVGRSR